MLAAQAIGKSKAYNLLDSEDVNSALKCVKKLGVKVLKKKNCVEIIGNGLNGFTYEKDTTIDGGNSGTLARLILGLLVKSKKQIKLIGDKSLSKRDFSRIAIPLSMFGAKIKTNDIFTIITFSPKPKKNTSDDWVYENYPEMKIYLRTIC